MQAVPWALRLPHGIFIFPSRACWKTRKMDSLNGSFLGPGIDEIDVRQVLKRFKAVAKKYDSIPFAY